MKRILFISPQPFFSTRGTPINIRAMAEVLLSKSYDVMVLTLPFGEDVEKLNIKRVWKIPFVKCPPIGPSFAKVMYSVLLFVTAIRLSKWADVIHGFEEGAMIGGMAGLIRSVPYIADVDSCMVTQLKESRYGKFRCNLLFGWIEKFFLRRARAAITVCDALTRSTAAKAPGLPVYQIEDFPLDEALVIDSARFDELRRRFAGKRVLLYTGNLEFYQGTDNMLRSFAEYLGTPEADRSAVLVVVGGTEDGIARLKALSIALGIEANVILEGQRLSSEMGAYMSACDFLLSPRSAGENVPLKLYTYLAAGKPLIATRILSHTQIVNEDSAFLAEPTVSGFAAAIGEALSSKDTKKKSQAGLALVKAKYSRDHFKRRLLEAYDEILPLEETVAVPALARFQNQ